MSLEQIKYRKFDNVLRDFLQGKERTEGDKESIEGEKERPEGEKDKEVIPREDLLDKKIEKGVI